MGAELVGIEIRGELDDESQSWRCVWVGLETNPQAGRCGLRAVDYVERGRNDL
jgi:hypothetical protein